MKSTLEFYKVTEKTREILLIDNQGYTTQTLITKLQTNYSRLRDFHNDPPFFMISVQLCVILAKTINASLVSLQDLSMTSSKAEVSGFPTVTTFSTIAQVIELQMEQAQKNLGRSPVHMIQSFAHNFVYCADKKQEEHDMFSFLKTLMFSANYNVRISLIISVLLIMLLIKAARNSNDFGTAALVTISALTSSGLTGAFKNKSFIFMLWMLCSNVLSTYYLGDTTSHIISPMPEVTMTKFEELVQHNYSLIYEFPARQETVEKYVKLSTKVGNKTLVAKFSGELLRMVETAQVAKSEKEFFSKLVFSKKAASIVPWFVAINLANKGNEFLTSRGMAPQTGRCRCHIGNELRFQNNFFFLFRGRHMSKLAACFEQILETGFVQVWWKELVAIGISMRVQERSRFISPTHLREIREPPRALKLDAKILSLMWLWIIGSVGSIAAFLLEVFVGNILMSVYLVHKLLWIIIKVV